MRFLKYVLETLKSRKMCAKNKVRKANALMNVLGVQKPQMS
jgi:hypothetical protein